MMKFSPASDAAATLGDAACQAAVVNVFDRSAVGASANGASVSATRTYDFPRTVFAARGERLSVIEPGRALLTVIVSISRKHPQRGLPYFAALRTRYFNDVV